MNNKKLSILACLAITGCVYGESFQFAEATAELKRENTLENLFDKDPETIYRSETGMNSGDCIEINLPEAFAEDTILAIKTGRLPANDEFKYVESFEGAEFESSKDGTQWQKIGRQVCEYIAGTVPAGHTRLRLRATKDLDHRIALTELTTMDRLPVLSKSKTVSFAGGQHDLTVNVQMAGAFELEPQLRDLMDMYFELWGTLVDAMGVPVDATHKQLNIVMRSGISYPGFANSDEATIVIHTEHLQNKRADAYGLFVHELTHVIQLYPSYKPVWFIEGAADYTRYKFHYDSEWGKKFMANVAKRDPLGSYSSSSGFLLYIEETYEADVTRQVSAVVRAGSYSDEIWKELTGKSLAELCVEYIKDEEWVPNETHVQQLSTRS